MRIVRVLFAAALGLSPVYAAGLGEIELGKPFPSLWLPDLETGESRSLEEFRGKPLVLHVFASW